MTTLRSVVVLLLLFVTTALAAAERNARASKLDGFDGFVNDALRKWDVPGIAIAVVAGGNVIYAKGFGRRDVKNELPVTPDTLLPIGSITKSFTSFVMGELVDEGTVEWDKPVRNYMPEFRMVRTSLSEGLTPRDLLTHRSGVPRHDLAWYNASPNSRRW